MALRKAVFLQEHKIIYRNDISNDISKFQKMNYNLRTLIAGHMPRGEACIVEIPLCWSNILFRYVRLMIVVDEDILFQRVAQEYGGLKMMASVSNSKFSEIKSLVREATIEIDKFVQERLKKTYIEKG